MQEAETLEETTIAESPQLSQSNESLTPITGGVINQLLSNPKALRELIIGAVVIVVIISGIFGYKFIYKKK